MEFVPYEWLNRLGIHLMTSLANLSLAIVPFFLLLFQILLIGRKLSASLRSAVALMGFAAIALAALILPLVSGLSWLPWAWTASLPWSSWIQLGQDMSPMPLILTHARLSSELHWMTFAAVVWFFGALLSFLPFFVGKILLALLRRQAQPLEFPQWGELCRRLKIKRKVFLGTAPDCPVPITWGFLFPKVLLPASLKLAPWEDLEPVLIHELTHIRRFDNLRQGASRLLCSLFWFHPLLWILWKYLRLETEKACDNQVISCGHNHFSYAEQLVLLSRRFSQTPPQAAQALTAEQSSLGRRIAFLLSLKTGEKAISRVQIWILSILALFACLILATIQPVTVWEAKWLTLKDLKFNAPFKRHAYTEDMDPRALGSVRDLPILWPVAVKYASQSKDIIYEFPYKPFLSEALVKGPSDFPVVSAGDGLVDKIDPQRAWIQVRHSFGLETLYKDFKVASHLREGDQVSMGQTLGILKNQTVGFSMFWKGSTLARDAWPNFAGNKLYQRYYPEE